MFLKLVQETDRTLIKDYSTAMHFGGDLRSDMDPGILILLCL